jgi:RHS repeat-associated protein
VIPVARRLWFENGDGLFPMFYDGYGLPVWDYNLGSGQLHHGSAMRAQRQPFQYKGQAGYYADAHTGLYYCHHRYYNPVMARWMSPDPIGLEGGFNVYQVLRRRSGESG